MNALDKIKNLLQRIDESYNPEQYGNDVDAENEIDGTKGDEQETNYKEPQQKVGMIEPSIEDNQFKETGDTDDFDSSEYDRKWAFLSEEYKDTFFDTFFSITNNKSLYKQYKTVASQFIGGDGTFSFSYTSKIDSERNVSGRSHFLSQNGSSEPITNFDAIVLFVIAAESGRHNGTNSFSRIITSMEKLGHRIGNSYDDIKKTLDELHEFPLLQGYIKSAYYFTDQTVNNYRAEIKNFIIEVFGKSIGKIYNNEVLMFKFVPYLDIIRESEECKEIASSLLQKIRKYVETNVYSSKEQKKSISMSDSEFWKEIMSEGGIDIVKNLTGFTYIKEVAKIWDRIDGLDSVMDEVFNKIYILTHSDYRDDYVWDDDSKENNDTEFYKKQSEDDYIVDKAQREKFGDRRRSIILKSYKMQKAFKDSLLFNIKELDIEHMMSVSPLEWLEEAIEKENYPEAKLKNYGGESIYSPKRLHALLDKFEMLNKKETESLPNGTAFDFFAQMLGVHNGTQGKIFEQCKNAQDFQGVNWIYELGNNAELKKNSTASAYVKNLKEKGFGKLSLDIVGFKDTPEGKRNFVSIEYQGDQHYRPTQTEAYSDNDLYSWLGGIGDDYNFTLQQYWESIEYIINYMKNKPEIEGNKLSQKDFFGKCIDTLQKIQDSGIELGSIGKEIEVKDGNFGNDGNENIVSEIYKEGDIRKYADSDNRPKFKVSFPGKIKGFVNSCLRWYFELGTVVQASSDVGKFIKVKSDGIFDIPGISSQKNFLFYVCPQSQKRISNNIISNALHTPYQTSFYGGKGLSTNIKNYSYIKEMYCNTFRLNSGGSIDLKKCISIYDGKTTLYSAIKKAFK